MKSELLRLKTESKLSMDTFWSKSLGNIWKIFYIFIAYLVFNYCNMVYPWTPVKHSKSSHGHDLYNELTDSNLAPKPRPFKNIYNVMQRYNNLSPPLSIFTSANSVKMWIYSSIYSTQRSPLHWNEICKFLFNMHWI